MTYDDLSNEWKSESTYIKAYTSGSTGKPKEIRLDKSFVTQSALRTISFFNLTQQSHLHSCISPDFIGGKMMMIRANIAGCKFTYETPSNRPVITSEDGSLPDLVALVPSQMIHVVANASKWEKVTFIIGGSPIPADLRKAIASAKLVAYETYGMTETASHIAIRRVEYNEQPFITLPGIKVFLDSRGCLNINIDNKTSIITNDIATIFNNNSFSIKGRIDNVIISGGKKISPEDIEHKIESSIINRKFMITSRPDPKWGEAVILLIEGEPTDISTLTETLRKLLNPWEMPKQIEFTKTIPTTASGKILRFVSH
jgi:O-succinylbenzoic acid--CoA ligase